MIIYCYKHSLYIYTKSSDKDIFIIDIIYLAAIFWKEKLTAILIIYKKCGVKIIYYRYDVYMYSSCFYNLE